MPGTYAADANAQTLRDVIAQDPKVKMEAWSRLLHVGAKQYDSFSMFESEMDNSKPRLNAGQSGIFVRKNDLKAGGGDTVNFTVISAPSGPGVIGEQELTGNTSASRFKTYKVVVDWHRDAVEFTKKQIENMAGGRNLENITMQLLQQKLGIKRQDLKMHTLIKKGVGNVYRPNNRASRDAIVATDTLSVSMASSAKARLTTIGGQPLRSTKAQSGCPVNGYMVFASDTAYLNIRNEDGYQQAIAQGDTRGDDNGNFSGQLVKWQNMEWFEHPIVDLDWDGPIGSPLQPKAKAAVAFTVGSAVGNCVLKGSSTNVKNRYFQDFSGYDYPFYEDQDATVDSAVYYVWAVNPDGSVCFLRYTGSGNNGNQITVDRILASAAGTSTLGATTVGNLTLGSGSSVSSNILTPGSNSNLPTGFVYTDRVQVGAILIEANANGVPIGRGFVFGSNAACVAYGRIEEAQIKQERDYGFVKGGGYEMIIGHAPTINTAGLTNGYLRMEFAIQHEGYEVPTVAP